MKATRLIFRSFGNPAETLELEDFCLPPLDKNQVLLKIISSPINPADLNLIEGTYGIKPNLPACPGIECSAQVIESNSEKFSQGDLVMPLSRIGAWATHAITHAENLIRLPNEIDPHQASMLRINPATAWLLLTSFDNLIPGDFVALNAANSGVGQCIIQLAKSKHLRTICFLRNEAHTSHLESLGATHVFPDSSEGLAQAQDLLPNQPAKLAFNAVGGDSALRLLKLLQPQATHITYGAMGRKPLTIPNSPLIFEDIRFRGLWVTRWIENTPLDQLETFYKNLANLVSSSALIQPIDFIYNLEKFPEALRQNSSTQRNGKVLLSPHET